jgi:hypothetical protein
MRASAFILRTWVRLLLDQRFAFAWIGLSPTGSIFGWIGLTAAGFLCALTGLSVTGLFAALTGLSAIGLLAVLIGLSATGLLVALIGLSATGLLVALIGLPATDLLVALVGLSANALLFAAIGLSVIKFSPINFCNLQTIEQGYSYESAVGDGRLSSGSWCGTASEVAPFHRQLYRWCNHIAFLARPETVRAVQRD